MRRSKRRKQTPFNVLFLLLILAVAFSRTSGRSSRPVEKPQAGSKISGRVVAVSDGDTIRVLHKSREVKIRLWGVDSPEKSQDYGMRAKQFTSSLVFGKNVNVDVRSIDRYGRSVGWVTLADKRALSRELVKAGFAWWYRDYAPYDTDLQSLEASARKARRGLWAQNDPIPPWEYRRQRR